MERRDNLLHAGLRDATGMRRALERLADMVEDSGVEVNTSSLGDYEAATVQPGDFDLLSGGYKPFVKKADVSLWTLRTS